MNIRVVNMFRRYGLVSTFMKNEKKNTQQPTVQTIRLEHSKM